MFFFCFFYTLYFFFARILLHPISTLLPYTTLFRSSTRTRPRPRPTPYPGGRRHVEAHAHLVYAEPGHARPSIAFGRSEEYTSELQSRGQLVCCLLLEKKI